MDNWKVHIGLHALPDKKGKRTKFHKDAVAFYAKLVKESAKEAAEKNAPEKKAADNVETACWVRQNLSDNTIWEVGAWETDAHTWRVDWDKIGLRDFQLFEPLLPLKCEPSLT